MSDINEALVREIVAQLLGGAEQSQHAESSPIKEHQTVPVEVSARHIHLSAADLRALFGDEASLTPVRDLSQPGQFLSKERVRLVGPKGEIANVAILGPVRKETQVELSLTDARNLGVTAPVRMSGDLTGAGDILVFSGERFIHAKSSVIAAKAHIHMTPQDANAFGVSDKEHVRVRVGGERPITFEDVVVRVSGDFRLAMHIDFDEANACLLSCGATAMILNGDCTCTVKKLPQTLSTQMVRPISSGIDSGKKLIDEATAKQLVALGKKQVIIPAGAIVTPLARDALRSGGVTALHAGKER